MGRDPEQLEDWLSGRNMPIKRNQQMILNFLEGHGPRNKKTEPASIGSATHFLSFEYSAASVCSVAGYPAIASGTASKR